ncbi:hypothetical protein ACTFIT_010762 [Dictyostelium discoideum]
MSTNNNEDIDNDELQQQDNEEQKRQPQVSTFNEQQRQIREQQQVIDKQNQLLQQHIQLINQQSQQQLNNHSTPPSPNIATPITSAAITNTIKKSLGKINTDDTDHQLLQVFLLNPSNKIKSITLFGIEPFNNGFLIAPTNRYN